MKLFVGNLSFHTSEGTLQELFGEFGTVTDVHLVLDRVTHRSRGFAFVTMSSQGEGERAMESLNGKTVDGRPISVNEARPQEPRPPRGDFGGGDRGDRGDRGGAPRGDRDRDRDFRKGGFRRR